VPEPDSEFINEPDLMSEFVKSGDQFVEGLLRIRGLTDQETRGRVARKREKLRSYIVNTEPPFAADRIVNSLDCLDVPLATPQQLGLKSGFWRRAIRTIRAHRRTRYANSGRSMQKLGEIEEGEIQVPLTQWAEAGVLSQMPQLSLLGDQLWALH
jgi:hypothetical protein